MKQIIVTAKVPRIAHARLKKQSDDLGMKFGLFITKILLEQSDKCSPKMELSKLDSGVWGK